MESLYIAHPAGLYELLIMDGFEVGPVPFYSSPDSLISAFKGYSRERENLRVIIVRHQLGANTYQAQFSEALDAVLKKDLETAKAEEEKRLKILDIQLDFSAAPERYVVLYAINAGEVSRVEELVREMADLLTVATAKALNQPMTE